VAEGEGGRGGEFFRKKRRSRRRREQYEEGKRKRREKHVASSNYVANTQGRWDREWPSAPQRRKERKTGKEKKRIPAHQGRRGREKKNLRRVSYYFPLFDLKGKERGKRRMGAGVLSMGGGRRAASSPPYLYRFQRREEGGAPSPPLTTQRWNKGGKRGKVKGEGRGYKKKKMKVVKRIRLLLFLRIRKKRGPLISVNSQREKRKGRVVGGGGEKTPTVALGEKGG